VATAYYSPAPFPTGEEQRQAIVDRLLRLDLDVAELDRLAGMAADLFAVPMAAVTVLDGDRQWFAAKKGLSVSTTSRTASFCGHAIHEEATLCIQDARADFRFAGNPLVVRSPSIRFYVGAPIVVEGQSIGALCALSPDVQSADPGPKLRGLAGLALRASSHLKSQLSGR
jgi:GAF domain-containing protein